jgi:hypothetical protein
MEIFSECRRGRRGAVAEALYQQHRKAFCDLVMEIHSTLDFAVGVRGWCYLLERHGLRKGDFNKAEKLVTECRKSGDLPLDICAEDGARETVGIEKLDDNDIPDEVESWVRHLRDHAHRQYTPIGFWDDQDLRLRSRSLICGIYSNRYARNFTSPSPTSRAGAISTAAPP